MEKLFNDGWRHPHKKPNPKIWFMFEVVWSVQLHTSFVSYLYVVPTPLSTSLRPLSSFTHPPQNNNNQRPNRTKGQIHSPPTNQRKPSVRLARYQTTMRHRRRPQQAQPVLRRHNLRHLRHFNQIVRRQLCRESTRKGVFAVRKGDLYEHRFFKVRFPVPPFRRVFSEADHWIIFFWTLLAEPMTINRALGRRTRVSSSLERSKEHPMRGK